MTNIETRYLGLKLKNPIVVSSSGLTNSVEKIKKLEEYGAGAVVLKSLFEEQINYEAGRLLYEQNYPEAEDYVKNYTKSNSVDGYLTLIEEAKKNVSIPVIASVNCISSKEWVEFARQIENAGADALELNVFVLPLDKHKKSEEYEAVYYTLAEKIKKIISIPVSIKLGCHFTNILGIADKLQSIGIEGLVLFNRFYQPDMDIDSLKIVAAEVFSTPKDIRYSLRWVGLVSGIIPRIDVAASTGVHDGEGVIKQILAGAKAVQVCSTLYRNGASHLEIMTGQLVKWMEKQGFSKLDDFRGKLSYSKIKEPALYERSQFMKYFSSIH